MLDSIRNYVYNRRQGLSTTVGFVGGLYVAKKYLTNRLEEVKLTMEQERAAKDILRRRFSQTQENISFVVLAVMSELSEQMLSQMDVEALTEELRALSKARANLAHPQLQPTIQVPIPVQPVSYANTLLQPPQSSEEPSHFSQSDVQRPSSTTSTSSAENQHSERGSVSTTFDDMNASIVSSAHDGVVQSWVMENGSTESGEQVSRPRSATSSVAGSSSAPSIIDAGEQPQNLSESILSLSGASDISSASAILQAHEQGRNKAELWHEVKMLTFTRTLTTLYTTTLLTLLTTLQLTLLNRSKYVSSIYAQEREDRMREKIEAQLSISNILFQGLGGGGPDLEALLRGGKDEDEGDEEEDGAEGGARGEEAWRISEDLENKYLTLAWWLLHVGWKDVGERVRRAVEEVFQGVSLKTKLAAVDVHRLINDVRRRVEYEVTFEKEERRINFLSTMLPPTPETIQHVLTQGGYSSPTSPPPSTQRQQHIGLDSSTSLSTSQLSHDFFDSPALGLSNMHHSNHPHLKYPQQPQPQFYPHIPPPPPNPLESDPKFFALVQETRQVICSSDFEKVLEVCLDLGTDVMLEWVEEGVFGVNKAKGGEDVDRAREGQAEAEGKRIRLADLLPKLARWSQMTLNSNPSEVVDALMAQREVGCLSAIVFGRFEERFR